MPSTPGVPGGALPFSGPIDLATINAEWGLGTDLTVYHGVKWYYDGNLTNGVFNSSTLNVSDFYGKRATDPAGSGVYFSNSASNGSFVAPLYRNTITIEIWGAGGGGGGADGSSGSKGTDTSILSYQLPGGGTTTSDYTAGGGQGGQGGSIPVPSPPLSVDVSNRGRDPVVSGPQTIGGGGGYGMTSSGQIAGPGASGGPVDANGNNPRAGDTPGFGT
jgi:hypothetical protein